MTGGAERKTGDEPRYWRTETRYDVGQGCRIVIVWDTDGHGVARRIDGRPFKPDSTDDR